MGRPKALLEVGGVPLILLHVRAFSALGLRVGVVVGAHAEALCRALPTDVQVHVNAAWATTGPADSAWIGLSGRGPCLLTPVDVPPAREVDLRRLLAAPGPAVLTHGGQDGHPVRVDPPHRLARLDERLRGALRLETDDPAVLENLNTPEEWAAWLHTRARGTSPTG